MSEEEGRAFCVWPRGNQNHLAHTWRIGALKTSSHPLNLYTVCYITTTNLKCFTGILCVKATQRRVKTWPFWLETAASTEAEEDCWTWWKLLHTAVWDSHISAQPELQTWKASRVLYPQTSYNTHSYHTYHGEHLHGCSTLQCGHRPHLWAGSSTCSLQSTWEDYLRYTAHMLFSCINF